MSTTIYQSPFSYRYGSDEMRELFSLQHRHATWRKLWVALAEVEQELGIQISEEQLEELRAHVETIDFDKVSEFERLLKHDVMAHLQAYGIDCPKAKPILHLGATSCNITDNADLVQMREALVLINGKLKKLIRLLAVKAEEHKDLPCLSYTHFQAAQPTTVGKRFSGWLESLWLTSQKIHTLCSELRLLGMKGATGTQNSFMELFQGDHDKVEQLDERIASKFGFAKVFPISGQTYPREQDAEVLERLSNIAISAKKMSTDLRLLAHEKELEEPFSESQVGSSAMPYKRNPITHENICSLARVVMKAPEIAKEVAAEQWLERTLDDSASRRVIIPEAFLATDTILDNLIKVIDKIVIYPKMIARNLERELPFMATENILMASVKKGADRQVMHEKLRILSQGVGDAIKKEGCENDLLEQIANDPEIPLSKDELKVVVDPAKFVGRAPQQVENFLKKEIYPFLHS